MLASILPVLLPTLGLVRVPARANAAGRAGVLLGIPDVPYADSYKQAELSALWGALKKCYGSEAAAREAIARNNQIMCPAGAPCIPRRRYSRRPRLRWSAWSVVTR